METSSLLTCGPAINLHRKKHKNKCSHLWVCMWLWCLWRYIKAIEPCFHPPSSPRPDHWGRDSRLQMFSSIFLSHYVFFIYFFEGCPSAIKIDRSEDRGGGEGETRCLIDLVSTQEILAWWIIQIFFATLIIFHRQRVQIRCIHWQILFLPWQCGVKNLISESASLPWPAPALWVSLLPADIGI